MSAVATVLMFTCVLDAAYQVIGKPSINCKQQSCPTACTNNCCCNGGGNNCGCCSECPVTTTTTKTTSQITKQNGYLTDSTASTTATTFNITSASDATIFWATTIPSPSTILSLSTTTTSSFVDSAASPTTVLHEHNTATPGYLSTTSSNVNTDSKFASSRDPQVVAVVVSVVLAGIVVGGAFVVVAWRIRKRTSTSGARAEDTHTIMTLSVIDGPSHANGDTGLATRSKDKQNNAAGERESRKSEQVSMHIDSVTNLRSKSTFKGGESSVYNEPADVGNRKLPTAPAQDRPYFPARNPSVEHIGRTQQSTTLPGVYSLAHTANENTETPQYLILEEERKVASQNKADGGQYFTLAEGAGTDESDNSMVTREHNDVAIHDAHEYSPLDAYDRDQNSAVGDADYTPLHSKTGLLLNIPAKIHGEHEYSHLDPSSRTMKSAGPGAEYNALEHRFVWEGGFKGATPY